MIIFITVVMTGFSGSCFGGWFSASLTEHPNCSPKATIEAKLLKESSKRSTLYIISFANDMESVTSRIGRELGFSGMILHGQTSPDDIELDGSKEILFSGTIVQRNSSIFEKYVGGGEEYSLYYKTVIGNELYLLSVDAFDRKPFGICDKVKD